MYLFICVYTHIHMHIHIYIYMHVHLCLFVFEMAFWLSPACTLQQLDKPPLQIITEPLIRTLEDSECVWGWRLRGLVSQTNVLKGRGGTGASTKR